MHFRYWKILAVAAAQIVFGTKSYAADFCPYMYAFCEKAKASKSISGGAYPSFADMVNLNPASAPTIPTPVGLEAIYNTSGSGNSKPDYNLSLIKGFERIGTAASTNSENTFYSYNLVQAFQGTQYRDMAERILAEKTILPTINFALATVLFPETFANFITPSIGVTARYNKTTKNLDKGWGLSLNSKFLSAGVSGYNSAEYNSMGIPATKTTIYNVGLKLSVFNFDYTQLRYETKNLNWSRGFRVFSEPVHIYTATLNFDSVLLTTAHREAINILDEKVTTTLLSGQIRISKSIALLALYNYIPGATSVGLDYFF
jgi:hypothetical protein